MGYRELTAKEKRGIKELVTKSCANYCGHYKDCLPLDGACYMLNLHYWKEVVGGARLQPLLCGSACKYFKSSVLPLNPSLELSLENKVQYAKKCSICCTPFLPSGRQTYCSENCKATARKNTFRKSSRKYRQKGS